MSGIGKTSNTRSSTVSRTSETSQTKEAQKKTSANNHPMIGEDDAFEGNTGSITLSQSQGTLPSADPTAQTQLQEQLTAARLGGQVLGQAGTVSKVAEQTSKLSSKLASKAADQGDTSRADRYSRTSSRAGKTKTAAGVVSNAVKVLDGDASVQDRALAGAKLASEGVNAAATGAEVLANRRGSEALQGAAEKIGKTGKALKGVTDAAGKGLGVAGAVGTLTDDDASITQKAEAAATGGKAAAGLAEAGLEKLAKKAATEGAERVLKTAGKTVAKSIPILGVAADIAATASAAKEAYDTFQDPNASTGAKVGAVAYTLTQAAGVVPVVGDAISIAGDIGKAIFSRKWW